VGSNIIFCIFVVLVVLDQLVCTAASVHRSLSDKAGGGELY